MFCFHRSSKTIRSELCKPINSFSLQEAVAGVSGEERLIAVKETSSKRLFGKKNKISSKKGKVSMQESSSEPEMEIEFESNDSDYDVSDAECIF
jgi:hypothetical protein